MKVPYVYLEPSGGDDTQILQSALAALDSNKPLVLRGDFQNSALHLREKSRVRIDGEGATIKGGLDLQGTQHSRISGLSIVGDVVYGRGSTGAGGDLRLQDMEITGNISLAQADTSCLDAVYIHGVLTLTTHHDGLWKESTLKGISLRDCWFDGGIVISGLVQNVEFHSCFFSGSQICVDIVDHPEAGDSNQCHNISFYNCNAEASTVFIRVANRWGLQNVTINNLNWSCDTPHIIEIDTPYQLRNAYIQNISRSNPATETFKIIRGVLENVWYDGKLVG